MSETAEIVVKAESVDGEKLVDETVFLCSECDCLSYKYRTRCPSCGLFNVMRETVKSAVRLRPMYEAPPAWQSDDSAKPGADRHGQFTVGHAASGLVSIAEVDATEIRLSSGEESLDYVLGGGIYIPSVVLIGGDPGAGKSTLLTQIAANVAKKDVSYYGCGEESVKALAVRAKRLGARPENFKARQGVSLRSFISDMRHVRPKVGVLDSLQTFIDEELGDDVAVGSVTMVRSIAGKIHKLAHELECAIFIVCHVNKDGDFAGPKTVDHAVDANLMLTKLDGRERALTSTKNRNGDTEVGGTFEMRGDGLYSIG